VGSASAELSYEYYEAAEGAQYNALADVEFGVATPVRVGTSDTLDADNGNWIEQAGGHRGEDFAFRFTGYIVVPVSGETTFYLRSDDGSQLFIDGIMVVDNDGLHGAEGFPGDPGTITLDAGVYTIEATMFERGGGDSLYVNWSHGGFGARHVPDSVLFLEPPVDISVVAPTILVETKAGNPVPGDGAVDIEATVLEWTAGYGAVSHRVYLSSDATIDDADLVGETEDLSIEVAALDPGVNYSWRVDEVDADGNVVEGDVWTFTARPWEAHFPSPADGTANLLAEGVILTWTVGKDAILHNVYMGTDQALVAARDASTSLRAMSLANTVELDALDVDTAYHWAVDEWASSGITYPGPVWSFSTVPVIAPIDDESLVGWWTFDTELTSGPTVGPTSSATVLDMSGNGRHGLLVGDITFEVDPDMGAVLSLPGGTNQFVDIGEVGISGLMPKTIACWAKADHTNLSLIHI